MAKRYDYTEEEIRKKLEELGYSNIPTDQLKQFQKGKRIRARLPALVSRGYMRFSYASYIAVVFVDNVHLFNFFYLCRS